MENSQSQQDKMQKLRKAQVMIAKEIKRICEKYDLNYFLEAGSMLGAVRHQGFIPWDDDMDIGMLENDYTKFLEVAPNELDSKFFLDNYNTNKECGLVFSKLRLKNTIYKEKLGTDNATHQEIFVDIFPFFPRPENKWERKKQSMKLRILSQIFMAQSGFHVWRGNHGISKLKFIPIIILAKIHKKQTIYNKIQKVYNQCKDSTLVGVHDGVCYDFWFYKKDYLREYIDAKFEDETFKIPKEYDKILTAAYGDYMQLPPMEKRITHQIVELDLGNIEV